jgi:molybdopterin-containing oxidoreductase family iron-sulfur binding subunit
MPHSHDHDQLPPELNFDDVDRRRMLQIMAASIALASGAGCTRQPPESIVPYVRQPEDFVPGKPLFYATSLCDRGLAKGVLVESHLGRPTKIEGNPQHPASLGATDAFMQASVLTVYDPDRSQAVLRNGRISNWGAFVTALAQLRDAAKNNRGADLRILTGTITSPSLAAQIGELLTVFPEAKWHQYEPCGRHAERAGAQMAFGAPFTAMYRFDQARAILSLDADFLSPSFPGHIRYTRDYTGQRRRASLEASAVQPRLYVAEATPSLAGGMAEHRFRMRAAQVEDFGFAVARELGLSVQAQSAPPAAAAVARDLKANRGASIVIPGEFQPPQVHALAHAMNHALENFGKTVVFTDRVEATAVDEIASLKQLIADMRSGVVKNLLILGGNPVYDAPADLGFLDALQHVPLRMHYGLYANETAEWCHWHVPEAHELESWGDARAFDGTISLIQPLIAPIYGAKTPVEVLDVLLDRAGRSPLEALRAYWSTQKPGNTFDSFWQQSLYDGVMADTALAERTPPAPRIPTPTGAAQSGIEIVLRPDPTVDDGRFSNNAWLQELPKPQNKMTWENAAWISAKTAADSHLETGDVISIGVGNRSVEAPVWILPGHADGSVTLHFGYGRTRAGHVANGAGFNAYPLRSSDALWQAGGGKLMRVGGGHSFAVTQITKTMEERDPFRVTSLDEYRKNPHFARPEERRVPPELTLFPQWEYRGYKWAMSIDLTACIGCNACMVACQAENNIPVVGKEEVAKSRHMNWIRVDRYYDGPPDDPAMYFQPIPCMHCETAPCELVCPVAATVHSVEGLNEMVYNRCVGTRYCSNNCPYKVRRFNFFLYSDWTTPSLYGVRNPEVTVRSRGVMEKCSYCVQRIQNVRIEAEKEERRIHDGEIVTACQQACPASAIVFGDMNDPASEVARRKREPRDYLLLEELNTRPRTTYLGRLKNPNPEITRT